MSLLLGAGLTAIPSLIGGLVNMRAQRRAGRTLQRGRNEYVNNWEELIAGHQGDIAQLLEPQVYQRYMDTAEAQSAQTQARSGMQEGMSRALADVSRGGGTDAQRLAATGRVGDQYGTFMNRMAAYGTQWAQGNRDRLMAARQGLTGMKGQHAQNLYSMAQDRAMARSAGGQAFSNAMTGLGEAFSYDDIMKMIGGGE